MFTWFDFMLLVLAASAVIDVWRFGSLFEEVRAVFRAIADSPPQAPLPPGAIRPRESDVWLHDTLLRFTPQWVGVLLSCEFCLSYHIPWLVLALWMVPGCILGSGLSSLVWQIPLYSLAATKAVNLLRNATTK